MRRRIAAYSAAADLPPVRRARFVVLTVLAVIIGVAWITVVVRIPDLLGTSAVPAPQVLASTVGVLVPVVALVVAAYGVWRTRLEGLARRPGPVLVRPFVDRTDPDPGAHSELTPSAVSATAAFQRCLVRTRIYGSTAIPSTGSSSDFLRVVEQAGESASGLWAALSRFARVLAPQAAYVVRGEMVCGPDDRPALVLELSRLPSASIPPTSIRADTWDRVVELAAHTVAAAVLPRTRRCRTPPWTNWQGLRLPAGLFDLFQLFARQRDQRRFDEAMATLREALKLDPGNLALRLEMGKVQEQLEMHLDALLTYDDIVGIASRRDAELSSWWNRRRGGVDDWSNRRAPGLPRRHPVIVVARYRHLVMLGLGDRVAAQWWDRPESCPAELHLTAREIRRRYLRETLSTRFVERYVEGSLGPDGRSPAAVLKGLVGDVRVVLAPSLPRKDAPPRAALQEDLRVFLAAIAVREAERMLAERRRMGPRIWRHRGLRAVLPHTSLELILVWARMRWAMALAASSKGQTGPDPSWPPLPAGLKSGVWPPSMNEVGRLVRAIVPGAEALRWLDHFSAACIYALVLTPASATLLEATALKDEEGARAARAAVAQLSRAVAGSDSGYLGRQRDLLLAEDPDLDHLRSRPEFRDFEALTFGSVRDTQRRGPRIGVWEQAAHVADFVSSSAAEMARVWRRRLEHLDGDVDPDVVLRWVTLELAGWELAERLALDHRDWTARDEVARRIAPWAEGSGVEIVRRPHPRFTHERLARQVASLEGADPTGPATVRLAAKEVAEQVKQTLKLTRERMDQLARALRVRGVGDCCPRNRPSALTDEVAVVRGLADRTRGAVPVDEVRAWARLGAERWQALAQWFDDGTLHASSEPDRRERFVGAVSRRRVGAAGSPWS